MGHFESSVLPVRNLRIRLWWKKLFSILIIVSQILGLVCSFIWVEERYIKINLSCYYPPSLFANTHTHTHTALACCNTPSHTHFLSCLGTSTHTPATKAGWSTHTPASIHLFYGMGQLNTYPRPTQPTAEVNQIHIHTHTLPITAGANLTHRGKQAYGRGQPTPSAWLACLA